MQRHDGRDDAIGGRHRRVEPGLHERVEDALEARRRDCHGAEAVARMTRVHKLGRQHQEACEEELEEMQRQRRVAAARRDDRRKEGADRRVGVDRDERSAVMIPVIKHRVKEPCVRFRQIEPLLEASGFGVAGGQRREDQAKSHGREKASEKRKDSRSTRGSRVVGDGGGQESGSDALRRNPCVISCV